MVETPATTLATAPKMITSPLVNRNVPAASTAPKANTPARPSRNSAEAARKKIVCGLVRQMRRMESTSSAYAWRIPCPGHRRLRLVLEGDERGQGEDEDPQAAHDHRDADVEAVGVRHPEQPDPGLDEAEVQHEQRDDPAEVPQSPPEARDTRPTFCSAATSSMSAFTLAISPTSEATARMPRPAYRWPAGAHEEERGRQRRDHPRLPAQVADGAPGAVGVLAQDGGDGA